MILILEQTKVCIICSASSDHSDIGPINDFGECDLGLRPAEPFRSTIDCWIHRCPKCGYCAPDISINDDCAIIAGEIINETQYRQQFNDPTFPSLTNTFLCRSILKEQTARFNAAAIACINAAWTCDDAEMKEAAVRCRKRALEMIYCARLARQLFAVDEITERLIEIDLLRRSAQFDCARRLCGEMFTLKLDEKASSIVRYQKSLIERQDDSCHSLDEIKTNSI